MHFNQEYKKLKTFWKGFWNSKKTKNTKSFDLVFVIQKKQKKTILFELFHNSKKTIKTISIELKHNSKNSKKLKVFL